MSVSLFTGFNLVAGTFSPSKPLIIQKGALTIDFTIVVATGATSVRWFPEFLGADADPNAAASAWFREVAEEDVGSGVVNMPKTIRIFQENGGAALAIGTHTLTVQLLRNHGFARIQAEIVAGGGTALMTAIERNGLPAHTG